MAHNLPMIITARYWRGLWGGAAVVFLLAGCMANETTAPGMAVASPTAALEAAAVSSPTAAPTAPVPSPAAAAIPASPTTLAALPSGSPTAPPAPTAATAHPMFPYTIAGMREREYPGGEILIANLQEENEDFRRYTFVYPSDGLAITGVMNIPRGRRAVPGGDLAARLFRARPVLDGGGHMAGGRSFGAQRLPGYRARLPQLGRLGERAQLLPHGAGGRCFEFDQFAAFAAAG